MFAVCGRRTMANAKRIVPEPEPHRPRRQRLAALSLSWIAKKEAKRLAYEKAIKEAMSKPLPVPLDLSWMIRQPQTAAQIADQVAAWHGLKASDLFSRNVKRTVTAARLDAIAAVRVNCRHLSLSQIAKLFKRDHSTIISALRQRGLK